eukprot:255267-Pleurochrysis_carterae.AAC.1
MKRPRPPPSRSLHVRTSGCKRQYRSRCLVLATCFRLLEQSIGVLSAAMDQTADNHAWTSEKG